MYLAAVSVSAYALVILGCGGSYRDAPIATPPVVSPQRPQSPPDSTARVEVPTPAPQSRPTNPLKTEPAQTPRPPSRAGSGQLEPNTYVSEAGQRVPYQLLTPARLEQTRVYPLVVFLHGASASGNDNQLQIKGAGAIGLAPWIDRGTQEKHPSFVLAPQAAPKNSNWVRQWARPESSESADREPLELVIELIDKLIDKNPIDPNRIYLTGLSMGGFGTWIAISRYPERFAAAIPVCGGGDVNAIAATRAAVWAFHGDADRIVPASRSRQMISALEKAGEKPRYTEYVGVGHDAWTRAFAEPELVDWLFSQTLAQLDSESTLGVARISY